ncbi:Crossover junction endodeoxyribonuclease RuvC [Fundidesulfovibrio magnetotacticus]|uniref:Crossover junction endodeoxyribonuclease RuvC n=1 Tax=Fundidesulfovibrio magnetotacticus TaxID=2730080 RepID=A0A6V8LZ71_9BACT|nr:crossover junction endodeoxyribonuclease RuvC [Fundidesulfovibrio magnetotacticus]GFK95086.1 Crossover junction endodeoxyribonuclease RuvC [Fundidesulfovibrio magnetotacticus]
MSGSCCVLGLDPGSRNTGFGIVREESGVLSLVDAGVIRVERLGDMDVRLGAIYEALAELLSRHKPGEAALEDVFVSRNPASALKLGQARGAAMAACAVAGVRVHAYEPSLVKKSLVGTGRAEKTQVAFMVAQVLGCRKPLAVDATDALAVAVCHLNQRRFRRLAGEP